MAFGIPGAVIEARGSGRGQVVDAAMFDGATKLLTVFHGMDEAGMLRSPSAAASPSSTCATAAAATARTTPSSRTARRAWHWPLATGSAWTTWGLSRPSRR
jgi:crotonobetainyl-CoA:carnitine CoA-transferase CaiB-like acyl-CoA transferase